MWIGVNIAYAVPFLIDNIQVRSYRSNNGIHKHCLPCSDAYDDREAGGGGLFNDCFNWRNRNQSTKEKYNLVQKIGRPTKKEDDISQEIGWWTADRRSNNPNFASNPFGPFNDWSKPSSAYKKNQGLNKIFMMMMLHSNSDDLAVSFM